MITLCLTFSESARLFLYFTFLPAVPDGSNFSTSSSTVVVFLFNISGCEVFVYWAGQKVHEILRKAQINLLANLMIVVLIDCVDHNKLWKILKEMGIPDHLTCLLTNLYAKEMKVLCILARKNESINIFRLIKIIDPNAFVSQSSVIGVYGEGFDEMKVKVKIEEDKRRHKKIEES